MVDIFDVTANAYSLFMRSSEMARRYGGYSMNKKLDKNHATKLQALKSQLKALVSDFKNNNSEIDRCWFFDEHGVLVRIEPSYSNLTEMKQHIWNEIIQVSKQIKELEGMKDD